MQFTSAYHTFSIYITWGWKRIERMKVGRIVRELGIEKWERMPKVQRDRMMESLLGLRAMNDRNYATGRV